MLRALPDTQSAVWTHTGPALVPSPHPPSPGDIPLLPFILHEKCQQSIQGRALIWMSNKTDGFYDSVKVSSKGEMTSAAEEHL